MTEEKLLYQGQAKIQKHYGLTLEEAIREAVQAAIVVAVCLGVLIAWSLF